MRLSSRCIRQTWRLVRNSARNRMVSPRKKVIEKFLFLIDEILDPEDIGPVALPELAPEYGLVVVLKLDGGARRGLQFYDLADFQLADLAERHRALFQDGLEPDLGALDLLLDLLGP